MWLSRISVASSRRPEVLRLFERMGLEVNSTSDPAQVLVGRTMMSVVDSGGIPNKGQRLTFEVASGRLLSIANSVGARMPDDTAPRIFSSNRAEERRLQLRMPDGSDLVLEERPQSYARSPIPTGDVVGVREASVAVVDVRDTAGLLFGQLMLPSLYMDDHRVAVAGDMRAAVTLIQEGQPLSRPRGAPAARGPLSITIGGAPLAGDLEIGQTRIVTMTDPEYPR